MLQRQVSPGARPFTRTALALLVGLGFAGAAVAQDTIPVDQIRKDKSESAQELDQVEVTGSRIKRSQAEGPLPIVAISRDQIELSGEIGVAELLRGQSFNSFGSFTPTSGTSGGGQGGSKIDLRGLGSERTLVLIDGRRLPNSPGFSGAEQNVNVIPLVMVERVEILREGASAIYGSDAIGGVINIITKKDYNGVEFSTQVDRPTAKGGDGNTVTLSGGQATDKGNMFFAVEHYDKDMIFNRDREVARNLSSAYGYPGTVYQYDATGNPINTGTADDPVYFTPAAGCPTGGFDSDPAHPDSAVIGGRCRYRFASVAALTADLKRDSLTAGINYNIGDVTAFGRVILTTAESFGRFAPAPVDSIASGVQPPDGNGSLGITMAADNPNNPYGNLIVMNYRPTALGPRDNTTKEQINQYLFGVKGFLDWQGFSDWEVGLNYNSYTQRDIGSNYGLVRELQAAVDAGRFNPFDPVDGSEDEFRHTTSLDNAFTSKGLDAKINYELAFDEFVVPFVFGFEYRNDDFQTISDAESAQSVTFGPSGEIVGFNQSNVFGSGGGDARGSRSYKAAFAESMVQLFDSKLELGAALRYDNYSDVGSKVSPKLSLGFRPLDSLLARASWSKGFRAPDLTALYGSPAKSAEPTIDVRACDASGGADVSACTTEQRTVVFDSNKTLKPETSDSLSAGIVWNVLQDLSVSLDYYNVTVKDAVDYLQPQAVFDNEQRCFEEGRPCNAAQEGYVVRSSNGGLIFAYVPEANAARLETNGLDMDINYNLMSPIGAFKLNGSLSRVLSYKRQDAIGLPLLERLDTLNGNGEIFPKFRANATVAWDWEQYNAALGANYIDKVRDCDASAVGDPEQDDGYCAANNIASYLTFDLQAGWSAPWNGKITLGVRNLLDRQPPIAASTRSTSTAGTFYELHDIDGRTPFLKYSQSF